MGTKGKSHRVYGWSMKPDVGVEEHGMNMELSKVTFKTRGWGDISYF